MMVGFGELDLQVFYVLFPLADVVGISGGLLFVHELELVEFCS